MVFPEINDALSKRMAARRNIDSCQAQRVTLRVTERVVALQLSLTEGQI
jgi:hypothetical protein